jgi:hypothetical protein
MNLRLKKAAQVIFFILGSGWFIPVSFVAGAMMGLPIMEEITAWREGQEGKPYFSKFYVMAETQSGTVPLHLGDELKKFRASNPDFHFTLSVPQGEIIDPESEYIYWRYTQEQLEQATRVTVLYHDDDYSSKSIYRVEKDSIVPIYSSFSGPGHLFYIFIFALILAKLIRFFALCAYASCTRSINAEQRKLTKESP